MNCTYKFTDASGVEQTITGKAAMKAYLAGGGLEALLPGWNPPVAANEAKAAAQKPTADQARANAELARLTAADSVTHQDPGEKPEAATDGVVKASLKTAAKNEDTTPGQMRKWLLAEIDEKLLQAPDRQDYDEAVKSMGEKDAISMFTGNGLLGKGSENGFLTFDVPGDGTFKVRNSVRGLMEFRKKVSASQGFKDGGQKPVKPAEVDSVRGGSGSKMTAITNMIDEGDFEAARGYAEAVGIKLEDVKVPRGERKPQWDQFLKDGTVPPPVDTRPLPPQRTPAQIAEDERLAKEAEAKKPKDTGWNMAGTGYGGKRYLGRNITTADGREIVARVYENAGNYDEVEVKVDGVRKFTVRDSYNAKDKADAFVKTLTEAPAAEPAKAPARVTPQISGNPEKFIKVAADSASELRKSDVDRVLTETPVQFRVEVARHIKDNRKDLADEVDEVMSELRSGSAKPVPAQIPEGYKPAGEPFYRGGKLTQGYAPFAPGERVTMKDSAGQSGVVESFASPDDAGVFASAVVKFDNGVEQMVPLGKLQAAAAPAQTQATGTRRDPAKVSMFNPYEDGDIVTINGQDWTVKQDTHGWYLTTTGNWRGQHPTIRNVKAMSDLIREVEQAANAAPVTTEPETQKLTEAEAKAIMEWQDLGQKDGVKTHILTFYESKADKDAKRGRMTVATITKGDKSAANWFVDGEEKPFAVLGMAKKRAEEIGMAKAVSDGFVEKAATAAPASALASKWDTMTEKEREAIAIRAGWSTATGGPNFIAKRIVKQEWDEMTPGTQETLSRFAKETTAAEQQAEQKQANRTTTIERHNAMMASVREGTATPEQFKASFNAMVDDKEAILAELDTKTKAELLREGGPYMQMRYANEKKADVVEALYRHMLAEYTLGSALSYGMGKGAYEEAIRKQVEATDADKLAQYVADRKTAIESEQAERAAKLDAIKNPQKLEDYRSLLNMRIREGKTRKEAFLSLTPEQRIAYDTLEAEATKDAREARKRAANTNVRAAGQVTDGEIIETKHTRDGYDLFVVQLSDRLSKDDYNTVLASAKRLGGWYSSFRGNGATPGFQFKTREDAQAFLKLAGGDTTAAEAQAQQRRDAYEDDKSQTSAERLRTMADKMEDDADEELNRARKTNTARRARFASAAIDAANASKAIARTMRNIAKAIEDGKAKFLDAVRTKTQVEALTNYVRTAKDAELRAKYQSYADQEKRKDEPATAETADFAEFPSFTSFRSDLASLARQMLEVDGTKKLGQRLMRVADDVTDAYLDFAKANLREVSQFGRGDSLADFASKEDAERAIKRSGLTGKAIVLQVKRGQNRVILSPSEAMNRKIWQGDGDKRITLTADFGSELVEAIGRRGNKQNGLSVPWQFQTAYDRRKALSRIGIETPSEFRSALREFIALHEQATANKVREMELAMVGRKKDGLDFFPTAQEIADQMVEAAEITPDIAVLEPSAGMGHLADRIRAAGAEPDVIEISPERRELLEEKGYHLAEVDDFMQMEPRKFFTYGDVFRAPDGTEGVMRGIGKMGSQRVRLEDAEGNRLGLYDRSELVGVRHMGTWSGYDRIIMNPPFSDRRDAEHVQHAYTLLKPGGRIVAIMGEGVFFGQDKRAQEFRDWLESVGGTSEKLPEGSFMDTSLPVTTAVNARMVVIDKPETNKQRGMEVGIAKTKTDGYVKAGEEAAAFPQSQERFKAGKALTKEQRKEVLKTLTDVYKVYGADIEMKGVDKNGNERYGYVHSPELFEKSDITGAMVRYYVTLPDGRKAHPTELFPDYTQSDIDAEMQARASRLRNMKSYAAHMTVPEQQFSTIAEAMKWWDERSAKSLRGVDGRPLIYTSKERIPLTNGKKFILIPNTTSGEMLEVMADDGWRIAREQQAQGTAAAPAPAKQPGTNDTDNGAARFSRTRRSGAMSKVAVQQIVDAIKARWANAPEVVVVDSMQDASVPQRVRDADAEQKSLGATGEPMGFWYGGKVYVVAGSLNKPADVALVMFHEALGHYGLRGVFGKELGNILNQIATMRRGDIIAKAREYGLVREDASGNPVVDVATATDAQVWEAMSDSHRRQAAEEVLAELSQVRPDIGFVKRAIAVIRTWLRENVPYFNNLKLTDAEIVNNYIIPARGFVERGAAPKQGNRQAVSMQRSRDGALRGVKDLADFLQRPAFGQQGLRSLKVPEQRVVLAAVADTIHDLQIFDDVVQLVPVDVMNKLFGTQGAAERLLNNPSMLQNLAAIDRENSIPLPVDAATAFVRAAAFVAAKRLAATSQGGLSGKGLPAVDAFKRDLAASVSAEASVAAKGKAALAELSRLAGERLAAASAGKIQDRHFVTPTSDGVLGTGDVGASSVPPILSGDAALSRTTQTLTEAFRRWFVDSKVVDADGKPLVVYHGTDADITDFKVSERGTYGGGIYLTPDTKGASEYAIYRGYKSPTVYPVYVSIKNPATGAEAARVASWKGEENARAELIARGYDGVIDMRSGEIVAFYPEQVKSAIGNNGQFDPSNADIRFSRVNMSSLKDGAMDSIGQAIKAVTATSLKKRAGFKMTDYLGIGLQLLGRRQIVDIYGDILPLDEYNRLVQQMEADKNEGGAEADKLVTRWGKLEDDGKLADLMHDATLAQIDPSKPYVEGDDRAQYTVLHGRYKALSDAAKQVYADARDAYKAHHNNVRKAIKERIERSEIKGERKAELLKQMDDEFFKAVKGVYFPLARFGQYAVTVHGPDGKVESVSRAETKAEAEALRQNLMSAFPAAKGYTVGRVMLSKDFIADRDSVGRGFMTELYKVLDNQDMDATQRAELEDTLGQLYLSSLPDLSWAKHGIHRKGTPGFSQDARRAFAQNMFHGSRYLAKLRYSDLMQTELAAMQKHVDDWRDVPDFDQNTAQRVVDEMNKRHESLMNPKTSPLSTALTSFGFVFHLGLSPASAVVNLSQTALVAYPIMGAKWGYGKASAALLKASAEAAKGKNDITASLNAEERAAYDEAVRAGTIDVTMAHDQAGIAQGEDEGVLWKIRPVMRAASFLFHHAERFNRQVTFVASYRLAREAGADPQTAFEQATKATYDGHYDYGACVDDATEILTTTGWKKRADLQVGDVAIATDASGRAVHSKVLAVNVYEGDREVIEFKSSNRFSMVLTPNHDAVIQNYSSRDKKWQGVRKVRADSLKNHHFILRTPLAPLDEQGGIYGEDFASLLGWIAAEGWYSKYRKTTAATDVRIGQSVTHNPEYVAEIRGILERLGGEFKEYTYERSRDVLTTFVLRRSLGRRVQECLPEKVLTPELVASMSTSEMRAFLMAFLKGDGTQYETGRAWAVGQKNGANLDLLQAMATMCGMRATLSPINSDGMAHLYVVPDDTGARSHVRPLEQIRRVEPLVWCPTTEHGTWIARRNGAVFVTGNSNRPRFMQGNVAKVLLLFKQYSQNMVYTLARAAYQSIKGTEAEKAEARKALAGLLTTHAMAAGVLGLPMVSTLLAAASMLGSGDDEPWDAEVALKNMLADTFGKKPAEVLTRGLSRLTPWDISGRVGLDSLIFPDIQEGLEGQRLAESVMTAALGPVAGIGVNILKGAQLMSEGHYQLGLEAMMPAVLRGHIKAIRYAEEGVRDKTGISVLDSVSAAGVAGQAMGFSPSEVRLAYEGKSAVYQKDRALNERRQELLTKAARATMDKDAEARSQAMQEIQRFNEKNPTRRITQIHVMQSVRNRERRITQAENGVYLPQNRRGALDAGRFAEVD